MSTLKGALAHTSGAAGVDLTLDITGASGDEAYIDHAAILKAAQLLGDCKGNVTTLAMHSAVENHLAILDAQTTGYVPSAAQGEFARYMGKQVITDDNVPYAYTAATGSGSSAVPAYGTATVYLFAPGAVAFNILPMKNQFETKRDADADADYIYVRRRDIMHMRGVKWVGTNVKNPTNAQLETAANWSKVYDTKRIRCVKLVGKIVA